MPICMRKDRLLMLLGGSLTDIKLDIMLFFLVVKTLKKCKVETLGCSHQACDRFKFWRLPSPQSLNINHHADIPGLDSEYETYRNLTFSKPLFIKHGASECRPRHVIDILLPHTGRGTIPAATVKMSQGWSAATSMTEAVGKGDWAGLIWQSADVGGGPYFLGLLFASLFITKLVISLLN